MADRLTTELAAFEGLRQELISDGREGQYALLHGPDLLGVFPNQLAAIEEGYARLGNVDFLTIRIEAPPELIQDRESTLGKV